MNSEFEVLSELFVELLIVLGILNQLRDHIDASLGDVLLNDLQNLVVLQEFSGDIQGQVFRVNDSLNKIEIFWDQVLAVVHDEDSSDVQLDVVLFLLGFEHVEGCSFGEEQDSFEL